MFLSLSFSELIPGLGYVICVFDPERFRDVNYFLVVASPRWDIAKKPRF